jgi:hypothetical protein
VYGSANASGATNRNPADSTAATSSPAMASGSRSGPWVRW